jgi:PAS domain S-box-containing protein
MAMNDSLPVKVLLVEDSPSDAALLQESLSTSAPGQFQLTHVETLTEGLAQLSKEPHDVMLLDLSLPDSIGRETFLRARAAAPEMPIVVLTGAAGEAIGLEAVRQGVQDYLRKGQTDGAQIARAIRYAIERARTEAELRRARDELELRVAERTVDLKRSVEVLQQEIGSREQAEEALRQSEVRYRTLFESAPVGIALSNAWGKVIAFNQRLCAMAGVTPEEARALPAPEFYVVPSRRRQLLAQVRKRGKAEPCEVLLKRKDGSTLLGQVHMVEARLGREKVLMTIVEDITKQKHDEWRLEGVRELLELFATKTSRHEYVASVVELLRNWCGCQCAGIRLLDEHRRLPYAACAGYSRRFLKNESRLCLGQQDCICIRVFDGKQQAEDGEFVSRSGSFFCNSSTRFAARLGANPAECGTLPCLQARYESLAHAPIHYQGRLLGTIHLADHREGRFPAETIAFVESVAPLVGEAIHRFQVEESLQESEHRFRSMFERHEAIMLLVEPKSGAIQDANPAAAAFYGYTRERLKAMRVEDLNALPSRFVAAQRERALRGDQSYFVFPHRLASGEVRTVEVHSSPIRVKGRLLLFSILHDITERKLLEKQILDISERERQRLGQDLHDSLGGQLTGVALMGKALAHKLASKCLPEAAVAEEMVRSINDSIGQTRAIARGLCPVELSASGLLSALREFASEVEQRFHIWCRFRADKGILIRDESVASHLFRIVQEAVHNAIRHGAPRTIAIRLAKAGDQIALEIRDDGTGLPSPLPPSKGMGLRTMKYRADSIGAEFTVMPGEGRGTIVSCLLPSENAAKKRTKVCR